MSLLADAAATVRAILEDVDTGFGLECTLEDPSGLSAPVKGFSADIAAVIDPETGQAVSGRRATLAVSMATLTAAGFTELPRGIADSSSRPWVVTLGAASFKVLEATPDRSPGIQVVTCTLEAYQR